MMQRIIDKFNELIAKLSSGTVTPDEGVAITEFISKLDMMEKGLPQEADIMEYIALGSIVKSLQATVCEQPGITTTVRDGAHSRIALRCSDSPLRGAKRR